MKFEEKIIQAVLERDDQRVISTLYQKAYPPIERTLKRQGADTDDIQDAFQDSYNFV